MSRGPQDLGSQDWWRVLLRRGLRLCVSHAINGPVAILTEQHRPVACEDDVHGAAPYVLFTRREPQHEVLILARGTAILERQPHDLVAGVQRAVPRTVQRRKSVALPLRR